MRLSHLIPAAALAVAGSFVISSPTSADVIPLPDESFEGASFFTADPTGNSPGGRGITETREQRQTFVLEESIEVGKIVVSLDVNDGTDGVAISVYEVADPLASSWAPGDLVTTFSLATLEDQSDATYGFGLTGDDVFTLDPGSYGITISNSNGGASVLGVVRHTNSGVDLYTPGTFYRDGGSISGSTRDLGVALFSTEIPEPASLSLLSLGALGLVRRRR